MPMLGPVATPSLCTWRVPLWVEDDEYTVQLSTTKLRMYDADTLPDIIKSRLAMIHAFPFTPMPESGLWGQAYHNSQDPRLDDIGWRVTYNMYMLILNQEHMEGMDG